MCFASVGRRCIRLRRSFTPTRDPAGGASSARRGLDTPAGFVRPRVDTLTDASKAASVSGSAEAAHSGVHPTAEDGDRALELVERLVSTADAAVFGRGLEIVRGTTRGWGFHLYDLAVALWELEDRPGYAQLRDALPKAYSARRSLPDDHASHLRALVLLRQLQVVLWVLESREHPTFRGWWPEWAREELDASPRPSGLTRSRALTGTGSPDGLSSDAISVRAASRTSDGRTARR
jgi:hypothetical protein